MEQANKKVALMSKSSIILAWQSMPPEMVRVLRPITNRVQYREALALMRQLWDQAETEPGLDTLLGLLTERLQTYEDRRFCHFQKYLRRIRR
jgi:hypothetical protein